MCEAVTVFQPQHYDIRRKLALGRWYITVKESDVSEHLKSYLLRSDNLEKWYRDARKREGLASADG